MVFAENLHTALAYWQGNRSEEAFKLWRSAILESMYLSSAPGNFQQLSFYDAIRGELYRDFADGIGMTARTLMEGLFGIVPDALNNTIQIKPGFPSSWDRASVSTPDIKFDFARSGDRETYSIEQTTERVHSLRLILPAWRDNIANIRSNGLPVKWKVSTSTFGKPWIEVILPANSKHTLVVEWKGMEIKKLFHRDAPS